MRLFGDWKFIVTLVATVAGVAVPVWLWQADLSSKSISISLVSRVPLQPKENESLPGMEISVEGLRLENPHLVVFEVKNDGSKPILAADFESPLDIRLETGTSFVRSRVTSRTPKDIEAEISTERQKLSMKPTLLNPKDAITITAITSGVAPVFASKARIVGVSAISLVDGTAEKSSTMRRVVLLVAAVLLLIASMVVFDGATESKGIFVRQRAAAFVGLVSAIPALVAFATFLEDLGIQGFWYFMLYTLLTLIPITFIAYALNRKPTGTQNSTTAGKS